MYSQKQYDALIKGRSKKYISENIREFTSDADFRNYFGEEVNSHIIKYSQLKNYKNISQLLRGDGDYRIMLYEQTENSGHWVLMLRYGNVIEYFDSYANKPNEPLKWSKDMNAKLDQYPEYLDRLLLNQNKFQVIYNTYPFQSEFNDSGTCGKHVLLRLIKFHFSGLTLPQYLKFFRKQKEKYNVGNDELVTLLIPVGEE